MVHLIRTREGRNKLNELKKDVQEKKLHTRWSRAENNSPGDWTRLWWTIPGRETADGEGDTGLERGTDLCVSVHSPGGLFSINFQVRSSIGEVLIVLLNQLYGLWTVPSKAWIYCGLWPVACKGGTAGWCIALVLCVKEMSVKTKCSDVSLCFEDQGVLCYQLTVLRSFYPSKCDCSLSAAFTEP